VTCLPGCFSMFRIKISKGFKTVPVLINPKLLSEYSQSDISTLHDKNLLLLGEDRFLTTLMLKYFPRRSLLFIPAAKCFTSVPEDFNTLLSQRRRWINSSVHNLLELLCVNELCGVFCYSMRFVVVVSKK
jgi:chitin synthase